MTSRVTGFLRRRVGTGAVLGEQPLDLPQRRLRTRAVWWTLDADVAAAALGGAGSGTARLPGALHAAEHAAIGMLPLFATCDRWDIGGVSTALHPDTLLPTINSRCRTIGLRPMPADLMPVVTAWFISRPGSFSGRSEDQAPRLP